MLTRLIVHENTNDAGILSCFPMHRDQLASLMLDSQYGKVNSNHLYLLSLSGYLQPLVQPFRLPIDQRLNVAFTSLDEFLGGRVARARRLRQTSGVQRRQLRNVFEMPAVQLHGLRRLQVITSRFLEGKGYKTLRIFPQIIVQRSAFFTAFLSLLFMQLPGAYTPSSFQEC